jgi:hypothetical protein
VVWQDLITETKSEHHWLAIEGFAGPIMHCWQNDFEKIILSFETAEQLRELRMPVRQNWLQQEEVVLMTSKGAWAPTLRERIGDDAYESYKSYL